MRPSLHRAFASGRTVVRLGDATIEQRMPVGDPADTKLG